MILHTNNQAYKVRNLFKYKLVMNIANPLQFKNKIVSLLENGSIPELNEILRNIK